uniref:threonine--tRNA ligase n=1 Tax=Astyanax mexicanus TaxID=7994 RepID=A0A8B9KXL1_ASTMX
MCIIANSILTSPVCVLQLHPSAGQLERLRLFSALREKQSGQKAAEPGQNLSVRLADGKTVKAVAGITTPLQIAQRTRIKGAVVGRVNGELWELARPLEADCELHLLSFDSLEGRQVVWRTGACVLGAVMETHFTAHVCREGVSDTALYCDYRLDNRKCLISVSISLCFRCGQSVGVCSGPLLPHTGFIHSFKMLQSEYKSRGFSEVVTPTLFSTTLWERSGHWEHYSENMFTVKCEPHTFALKPMNCPAHCVMYEQRVRSWRELPLRWADFGALHRNEHSGALGGLTRVRRFCQDDAHIFCTPEQLEEEITACLDFVRSVYRVFGFTFHCLLSTRPSSYLGETALWDSAEQQLERSLEQFGERWELNPGDGAFYGPKVDIQIRDAIGRQHQCATIQLDFQLPIRFNLQYVGSDGGMHRPVMVHRAVLGSLERMIAILAENFGGKWPLWLSPAQVMVLPVGGDSKQLKKAGFMADVDDDHGATLNKRIRSAQLAQYNYIFVVGEKERESGTVSVRTRGGKQLGQRSLEDVMTSLEELRERRSNRDEF